MADERRDRRIAEIDRDGSPQIDMIVLIDRDVDMVTPLCTQTTYEGLLDEVLGISATGTVAFQSAAETEAGPGPGPGPGPDADANASRNEREKTKTIRARLDSGDALFAELRDLNFGRACETLRAKSFAMQSEYRSMESDARAMSVSAIGGFVRKMRAAVSPGAGRSCTPRSPSARWTARAGTRTSDACASRRCWTPSACAWATPRSSGKPRCRACRRACRTRCASAETRASRRCASASRRWRSGARTCGARLGFWRWRA